MTQKCIWQWSWSIAIFEVLYHRLLSFKFRLRRQSESASSHYVKSFHHFLLLWDHTAQIYSTALSAISCWHLFYARTMIAQQRMCFLRRCFLHACCAGTLRNTRPCLTTALTTKTLRCQLTQPLTSHTCFHTFLRRLEVLMWSLLFEKRWFG